MGSPESPKSSSRQLLSYLLRRFFIYVRTTPPPSVHSKGAYNPFYCLLLLFCFTTPTTAQTSIVIRRTPKGIVVAADSKATTDSAQRDSLGRITVSHTEFTKCKIRQADTATFFAVSGTFDFDVDTLALQGCKEGGTFSEKVKAFDRAARPRVTQMIQNLWRLSTAAYDGLIAQRKPILEIVVFGVENKLPAFVTLELTIENQPTLSLVIPGIPRFDYGGSGIPPEIKFAEPRIIACPSEDYPANKSLWYLLGRREVINGLWDDITEKFWSGFGDVDGVRFLVAVECAAASEVVGKPIDVLSVDAKGKAEWKYRKPECAEIQQPSPSGPAKTHPQERNHR